MATKTINKQKLLDQFKGDIDKPRRPMTGFEHLYEISSDGAIYSIRLQRFLKPVFNTEKNTVELEFENNNELIRITPGKAVALSFFSPAQRIRIADEAYQIKAYSNYNDIKGHPCIAELAYKYAVIDKAILYILITSTLKTNDDQDDHLRR